MSDGHTFYIAMSYAAVVIAVAAEILAVRALMLERDRDAGWVQEALAREGGRA